MSRIVDEHRFDAIAAAVPGGQSGPVGIAFLDCDLNIRGFDATFETVTMRRRDETLGQNVFDVFPDNPDDPQATGSSLLAASMESALRRRSTDPIPICRYDITDPQNPGVYLPKLWSSTSTAVDDGGEQIGVLHRVVEITALDAALSALALHNEHAIPFNPAEQLHILSALAAVVGADRARVHALARERDQLRRALESRDVIGQAKGMLMERFSVDAVEAFDMLVKLSQRTNVVLAEIAKKVVEIDSA
ncbi:ANTAR domain-containing protein [Mycobacterium servetii]|uniref:ANTAR domain-containing protein n=1 Tax=Mycobacterium servetii TaxID=3237418 RepID=A0ABV4BYJ5_9MYCO